MNLTSKQIKFCHKYIETGNATMTYKEACNAENMNPNTINSKASLLLKNGKIRARIKNIQKQQREKFNITIESVTENYLYLIDKFKPILMIALLIFLLMLTLKILLVLCLEQIIKQS